MKPEKLLAAALAVLMCLAALISCANKTDAPTDTVTTESDTSAKEPEAEKLPSKFELQFSEENEKLLAEILALDIETVSVDEIIPELSVAPTAKVNAGEGAWTYIYENATKELYDECSDQKKRPTIKVGLFLAGAQGFFLSLAPHVHSLF